MVRKPWATTAWKKKRAEFLVGKKCEECGSSQTPLSIQYEYSFYPNFERKRIAYKLMEEYFQDAKHQNKKEEIKNRILEKSVLTYTDCCPKCGFWVNKPKPKFKC